MAVWPVHSATIGEDVELDGGLRLYLELVQVPGEEPRVIFGQHDEEETSTFGMSVDESLRLRDLLNTAAALVLREGVVGE